MACAYGTASFRGAAFCARGVQGGNMSEGVSPSPGGARAGLHTHNLIGGAIVAVIALALLIYALLTANAGPSRVLAGALLIIGIGVAIGLIPVAGPRDFYGGVVLVNLAT